MSAPLEPRPADEWDLAPAEWAAWLTAPPPLEVLLAVESREAARQHALTEAWARANELADQTEAAAVWDRVAADVALADLDHVPANPHPEPGLPSAPSMIARLRRAS